MAMVWCRSAMATAVLLGLCAQPAAAQKNEATLVVDHQNRTTKYDGKVIKNGGIVGVRSPYSLKVEVTNSNSALFDCTLIIEAKSSPDLDAVFVFTKALGPYAIELASQRLPVSPNILPLDTLRKLDFDTLAKDKKYWRDSLLVDRALRVIDSVLFAKGGLRPIYGRTLAVLDSMRRQGLGTPIEISEYKDFVEPNCVAGTTPKCSRLTSTRELASALMLLGEVYGPFSAGVEEVKQQAGNGLGDGLRLKTLEQLLNGARKALADTDDLLGFAYGTEKIVRRTFNASRDFHCEEVKFGWNSAREIAVSVTPSAIPAVARTTNVAPYATKVTATPDLFFRPTVGLSFLAVRDAEFPKYATKKINDSTFNIGPSGSTDGKYTYGLTMAFTWRGLDHRDKRVPFAIYLPDLTVNPSADLRAVALGFGMSFWNVKLGAGRAWTKHSVLTDGQVVGASLKDPDELSTREAYGRGQWYWSVALVGVPPFVP